MWLYLLLAVGACLVGAGVWLLWRWLADSGNNGGSAGGGGTQGPGTITQTPVNWAPLEERVRTCEEVVRAFVGPGAPPAAAYRAMLEGFARFLGGGGGAQADDPAYWQGAFKRGVDQLTHGLAGQGVLHALGAGDAAARVQKAAVEAEGVARQTGELEKDAVRLREGVAGLTQELAGLRERVQDLQRRAGAMEKRLPDLLRALEQAAVRPSLDEFHTRREKLVCLCEALKDRLLPLLERDLEPAGYEAPRYYRDTLDSVVRQMERGLKRAEEPLQEPEGSGSNLGEDERLARLQERVRRMRAAGGGHPDHQAQPLVQQYLRPLADTLLRDFVTPLLLEARGDPRLDPVANAVREVLRQHGLEVIEPPVGARIVAEPGEDHGACVLQSECEEVEVLPAGPDAPAETVAALVEPGCRWEGAVIARARVRSYR